MIDRAIFKLFGIRSMMLIVLVFAIARAVLVIGQSLSLAYVIVGLCEGTELLDLIAGIALFFICFLLLRAVALFQTWALDRYASSRTAELRDDLLGSVYDLGLTGIHRYGSSALVSAAIQDIDDIKNYIVLMLPKIVSLLVVSLLVFIVVFQFDWISGLIALVAYPVIVVFMIVIGRMAQTRSEEQFDEFMRMSNHFIDSLRGMDTLKAFGKSHSWTDRVFEASERFRVLTLRTMRVGMLSSQVLDLISLMAQAAVALSLGLRLMNGNVEFFPALALVLLVPECLRPLREFGGDFHASLDGRNALALVMQVIDEGQAARISDGKLLSDSLDINDKKLPDVLSHAALTLDGISYTYTDDTEEHAAHEALRDISLKVEGPCKVGIIGASGAGKSTLMDILAGFADPTGGRIDMDGLELTTLRDPLWHEHAAFISQDPYLFHMTLRDNISLYCPDATDDAILAAAHSAGLDDVIAELPEGLDTVIGDGARMLSGGQMQRVALARAFLDEKRTVLFFDEPTSHLDIETEMELKENFLPLMNGKLVFFATHRLHWVEDMDYLIELQNGCIVWQGEASAWPGV